jgi:hypothetical protein
MWPALAFRTRKAAREFLRERYVEGEDQRRPRVERIEASVASAKPDAEGGDQ